MIALEDIKLYCKIDCASTEEDALLEGLMHAAKEYMQAAGIAPSDGARYALAIKAMVLHFYSGEQIMSPALRNLINQLKFGAIGEGV